MRWAVRWKVLPLYAGLAAAVWSGCGAPKPAPQPEIEIVSVESSAESVALQAELDERNAEVSDLKAEIDHLRLREEDLTQKLKQALRTAPGKTISDHPSRPAAGAPQAEATIKQLQEELKRERAKRQQLEQQLAKLKIETSSPPIPPEEAVVARIEPAPLAPPPPAPIKEVEIPAAPEAEPEAALAPPPPIEPEPARIPPPSASLHALPEPTGGTAGEIAALRARSIEQETKHQEAIASLALVLDADRRRQEDLEAQLVALRSGAPGTEGAVTADSNEVNHLRSRLEEERRRNAELTAKLKLAGRVTDLVFRMQQPAGSGIAAPPPPAAPAWPRYSQQDTMPNPSAPNQPYMDAEGNVHQPIAPRVEDVAPPAEVESEGLEVPQIEQPPVFENEGPDVVEETTQD